MPRSALSKIFSFLSITSSRLLLALPFVCALFFDLFLLRSISEILTLFIILLWLLILLTCRLDSRVSINLALGFLILCAISLALPFGSVSEKFAIWFFNFFLVGIVQRIIEVEEGEDGLGESY